MWNIRKPRPAPRARGMTLVEMLMATALTLIMFAAVAQIFGMMGSSMRDARATIELSGNLRSVRNHLQNDLNNLTVEVLPWVHPGAGQGYFEIIEGPDRDVDFAVQDVISDDPNHNGSVAGDADDIICFTAYSKGEPFVGLIQGHLRNDGLGTLPYKYWIDRSDPNEFTVITSQYAEIVYFTKLTPADDRNLFDWNAPNRRDANETVTLYRRTLLIRPDIYLGDPNNTPPALSYELAYAELWNNYDLSVRSSATNSSHLDRWQTNSLEDLQNRQNRVAHNPLLADGMVLTEPDGTERTITIGNAAFPYPLRPQVLLSFEQMGQVAGATDHRDRTGEDVVLSRVLAFDIKVFDPGAIVKQDNTVDNDATLAIQPGDPNYNDFAAPTSVTMAMSGAYVDLNWGAAGRATQPTISGTTPDHHFGGSGNTRSSLHNISLDSSSGNRLFESAPGDFDELYDTFPQIPSMLQNPGATLPNLALRYSYYDTWPFAYEIHGVDRNGDGIPETGTNLGTNGFDDNNDGIVDDVDEYETSPPYPVPLRGISITVRAIEEGSRQVRQDTIMADFLPK